MSRTPNSLRAILVPPPCVKDQDDFFVRNTLSPGVGEFPGAGVGELSGARVGEFPGVFHPLSGGIIWSSTFSLGDIITIQDEDLADNIKVRLIYYSYDVLQPWKCSIKLGDPLNEGFIPLAETTQKMTQIYGNAKYVIKNFDLRNDRVSTAPADPVIAGDGTAVDHVTNQDASCDISFEWDFTGSGDAYDVDGFLVYVRSSTSSSAYVIGTNPNEEQVHQLPSSRCYLILRGQPVEKYYTFGVQSYRVVDPDVDPSGMLISSIAQPSSSTEDPYQPESLPAFEGDVTGTVAGTAATMVAKTVGFGDGSDGALNTTGNVTFSVTADGEPLIKRYTSVTINAGHTVTVNNRCKGLIIQCTGNMTINGAIRMDDKAAHIGSGIPGGTSANFAIIQLITSNFSYMSIPVGGAGGDGGAGSSGQIERTTSGGWELVSIPGGLGGIGGNNSAFGGSRGGNGGGGGAKYISAAPAWLDGGNGGGSSGGTGGTEKLLPTPGRDGAFGDGGGILALIVGGNLTIGATGVVSASATVDGADGLDGQDFYYNGTKYGGGGGGEGGKGGGVVVIAYQRTYTNNGSVLVNASSGGAGGTTGGVAGSDGQVGSIMIVPL